MTDTQTAFVLVPRAIYRHKKRGTEYVLIGMGKMQTGWWLDELLPDPERGNQSVDMREVAIYCSVTDQTEIWVRPREEFIDGRFELVPKEISQPVSVVNETDYVSVPRAFLEFVKTAPVASGVCCCGQPIDQHHDHQPIDQWDYSLEKWLIEIGDGNAST